MPTRPARRRKISAARNRVRNNLIKFSAPPKRLTNREFAEKYVHLPRTSPFGNVPFRCNRQPYVGLLFDEIDNGGWKTILVSGPSQSGKTLSAFVIPTLHDVVVLRFNTIIGFPDADMAADKWDTDFKPTMEDSPDLVGLLPTKGPGSKGGRIRDRITLNNKVDLKIMTVGSDDTGKAGYTSPRIHITEAAGWTHAGESSVEANPLRQLKARMKAFKREDPRRCLMVEGTLTIKEELPWLARGEDDDDLLSSTQSRILTPCPHCRGWISPERKHLVGWKGAKSENEAANNSVWLCPLCEHTLSNDERRASNADCRLVHHGQSVNEHGEVVGETPETSTLWFHWKAWHNLLRDAGDFGVAEWEAAQTEPGTEDRENAEKELCQFDFSVPFVSELAENIPLKAHDICKRVDEWQRNLLPPDTQKLTVGVDMHDKTGYWFAIAWRECGLLHVPAYGAFDVLRTNEDDLATRFVNSLHEFADGVIEQGFAVEGKDGLMLPDEVWIDCGYRPDDVADFVRSRGKLWDNKYKAVRGRGVSSKIGGYTHKNRIAMASPRIGTQWYAELNYKRRIPEHTANVDYWKHYLDARLRTPKGNKGAMTFPREDLRNEHSTMAHHLCNEQFKREWVIGKGLVGTWVVTGNQHWKDAAVYACVAGDAVGYRLKDIETIPNDEPEEVADNFYLAMMENFNV